MKDLNYPYMDEILGKLMTDSFSIFCGAGATADYTHKKWEDIFSKKTQEFYYNRFSEDIYFLSELEKKYYNKKNFMSDILSNIKIDKSAKSNHLNAVVALNLNQIWTTNFDVLIETTIKRVHGIYPTVIASSQDLLKNDLNGKYVVYKMNGTVQKSSSMVLTKSDFYRYFKRQRLLFEILKRQLVLDSFMFIGYSFKDDLVLNALREIKDVFPNNANSHYRFIIREAKEKQLEKLLDSKETSLSESELRASRKEFDGYEKKYFEDEYNIKTIELDTYVQIDDYLTELYRRFCNRNVLICGSFRSIDNELRIRIEQIVDKVIEGLFRNKFNIYSGNGRGLGEIVVARSALHAKHPYNRLINRPIIFTGDSKNKKEWKNRHILKDCSTMLIICGQDETLKESANVFAQFKEFLGENRLIIPLASTGYAAAKIYKDGEFRNSYSYRIARERIDRIAENTAPSQIAEQIVNLILTYRSEQNSLL